MARPTNEERKARSLVIGKSWEYLNNNFHKFSEEHRIRVALDLAKADLKRDQKHSGQINLVITEKIREARQRLAMLEN